MFLCRRILPVEFTSSIAFIRSTEVVIFGISGAFSDITGRILLASHLSLLRDLPDQIQYVCEKRL